MKKLIIIFLFLLNYKAFSFPIPKDNEVIFDILRKNKIIGSVKSTFIEKDNKLHIRTILNIDVKILFFPAYEFFQDTTETWLNGEFVEIDGYTDFEDEREYFVKGYDKDSNFLASGMDGDLKLNKNILPLNYWNKKILEEKEVFDTQKGIVRKITIKKLQNEEIELNNKKINTEKYTLDASKNPKDKGPFPQYTLWYNNDELIKFEFIPHKQKKKITIIQKNWNN